METVVAGPHLCQMPPDVLLRVTDYLPFPDVCRLLLTCRWTFNVVRSYPLLFSQKTLSAFGIRTFQCTKRATGSQGLQSSGRQTDATLPYTGDTRSLWDMHVLAWNTSGTTSISAHDSVFLVELILTDNTPPICLCHVSYVPTFDGFAWPASWSLLVDSARPLEVALSSELDLLAVLCTRDETANNPNVLEVRCYRLSGDAQGTSPFRTVTLSGHRFNPGRIPRHQLRSRLFINGELMLIFVADTSDFSTAFVSVATWSRIGWGNVVQRLRGRSHDVGWLSRKVFGVLSDTDGLDTYEVTYVWPLTVENRASFSLPACALSPVAEPLTLDVSACVVSDDNRIPGWPSFYESRRARDLSIIRSPESERSAHGILVINIGVPDGESPRNCVHTLVVALSFIVALALGEGRIEWEKWSKQVCVKINKDGQNFRGHVARSATVEWRALNDIQFREDSTFEGKFAHASPTDLYLVITDYCTPSTWPRQGETPMRVIWRHRDLIRDGTRRAGRRSALRRHVASILHADTHGFEDTTSNALMYREEIVYPDVLYPHMLFEGDRLWMAEVNEATSAVSRWDVYDLSKQRREASESDPSEGSSDDDTDGEHSAHESTDVEGDDDGEGGGGHSVDGMPAAGEAAPG